MDSCSTTKAPVSKDEYNQRRQRILARLQAKNPRRSTELSANNWATTVDELQSRCRALLNSSDAVVEPEFVQELENTLLLIRPGLQSRRLKDSLDQLRIKLQQSIGLTDSKQIFTFASKAQKTECDKPSALAAKPNCSPLGDDMVTTMNTKSNSNLITISNKQNESIRVEESDGKEISINNLEDCRISVTFSASTVQIKCIKNCTLVFAPVSSSVLVRDCVNSTIVAAAQQIRVHSSQHVRLHVALRGALIIEDCANVEVAPYRLQSVNLEWNNENWKCVKDFNWLAVDEPSPHWKIMNECAWNTFHF